MSISSDLEKLFVVLEEIRKNLDPDLFNKGKTASNDLTEFLENVNLDKGVDVHLVESFLEPVEPLRRYPCSYVTNLGEVFPNRVESFLIEENVCVGSFDGSSYDPGAHFRVNIYLTNVGYWVCNYPKSSIKSGNRAKVFVDVTNYREIRIKTKEFEYKIAEELFGEDCNGIRVLLYDESFNLRYTMSWDAESRNKISNLLKNHLEKMVKKDIIPVAVFYTRSTDIYRFYEAYKGDKPIIDFSVPDKILMNHYLGERERSSLFKVRSRVVDQAGLELLAFYMKTEGGVMRIEFPEAMRDRVDLIHCVVLSQSILGGGYPLALQRAHEWAVLTYNDRQAIEEEIARLLKIPYPDMLYSAKRTSKRWPIA